MSASMSSARPAEAPTFQLSSPQPRPNVIDQLDRITPRFDALVHRAGLGPLPPHEFNRLEHDAQEIARDIVAAFRGQSARPALVNPPLRVSQDGLQALF